ncbi:MAG TPA: zf-HC2 domain-containing protein [Thermoleophilaceae bacterium]|nr:zf-HC2 domain-containing protein [Thermoleophilaceae bacterium]
MNQQLPEMPCQELVEVITDYLEGALPERDRIRFEEHLDACGKCREYVTQFERTIRAVGVVREQELDPEVREGLMEAFRGWSGSSAP